MRLVVTRAFVSLGPGQLSMKASLVLSVTIGVGVAALAMAGAADAEDAAEADSASAALTQPEDATKGERRRERRRRAEAAEAEADEADEADEAAEPAEADAAASSTRTPALECRSIRPTGTRMPRRVCDTAEAWASVDDRSEEAVNEMQRRGREQSTFGSGTPPSAAGGT
jgi:cytoskeletal protein RodZ